MCLNIAWHVTNPST